VDVKILYDNNSLNAGFLGGWGFSCLVDNKVLFDTGGDAKVLAANMGRMEAEPSLVCDIVISHDHWDHTGGLEAVLAGRRGVNVHACPGFSPEFKQKVRALGGNLVERVDPREIREDISVTGMILGKYKEKDIEEQALVIRTPNGLTVITGCAHPGIVSIVRKTKETFNVRSIYCLFGGFHLGDRTESEIAVVAGELKSLGVRKVGPCHCSGDKARGIFRDIFAAEFVAVSAGTRMEV